MITSKSNVDSQYTDSDSEISGRKRRYPIVCDSQTILVTANLRDALQMLNKSKIATKEITKQKYVWIDALCVDQENIAERNAQVANMAETFKAAQGVIVWLGKEDDFTADAVEVIEQISAIPETVWPSVGLFEYLLCKLKLSDPHAIPAHLAHEYLARSEYDYRKRTEFLLACNLLLHRRARNVRSKLLTDFSTILMHAIISIKPVIDGARTGLIVFKS